MITDEEKERNQEMVTTDIIESQVTKRICREQDCEDMRNALKAISSELNRFISETCSNATMTNSPRSKKRINHLQIYLLEANKKINCFKSELETACNIAKSCAKCRTTCSDGPTHCRKKEKYDCEEHHRLKEENERLRNHISNLCDFIQQAYTKLKSLGHEPVARKNTIDQLKEIIFTCGEYYKSNQCLKNRINNLECQLDDLNKDLDNLKLNKKTYDEHLKNKLKKCSSECQLMQLDYLDNNSVSSIKLSEHFEQVRSLLINENKVLLDLENITNEISKI